MPNELTPIVHCADASRGQLCRLCETAGEVCITIGHMRTSDGGRCATQTILCQSCAAQLIVAVTRFFTADMQADFLRNNMANTAKDAN